RAGVRFCAPGRILVGGHGARLLLRLRGQHGETAPVGSCRVRREVHRGQAARHRCSHLAGRASRVEPHDIRFDRAEDSSVRLCLPKLALFVALAWLAPVAHLRAQTDTGTTSFDVNGVKVILRRNGANDVITANVYLLGGTQQLSPATQGIEMMLLRASERGTKRYPGEKVRQALVKTGCTIGIAPSEDWTVFGTTCVRPTFDSAWSL